MFDIGAVELLIIAIVAIIVVGPKDLPALLRKIGGFISYIKKLSADFQSHIRDTVEETGIHQVKETFEDAAHYNWTEEDDLAAKAHNEKIMNEFDPQRAPKKKKTTTRASKTAKTTPRKTKTTRTAKPRAKGGKS